MASEAQVRLLTRLRRLPLIGGSSESESSRLGPRPPDVYPEIVLIPLIPMIYTASLYCLPLLEQEGRGGESSGSPAEGEACGTGWALQGPSWLGQPPSGLPGTPRCFCVRVCSWATESSLRSGNLNKFTPPSHTLLTWSCGGLALRLRAALQPEGLALDLALLRPRWKVVLRQLSPSAV